MTGFSRKLKVVYTIPIFSQECEGMYARFHDVIHTLQRTDDPPWDYTIVPMRRYNGDPSSNVLFQDGSAPFRLANYLRHVLKASRNADIVHVVHGDFLSSLLVSLVVRRDIPLVAGPNVIIVGTDPDWVIQTRGGFQSRRQELATRLGLSPHHLSRFVFHRRSPFSARFQRIFVFCGYRPLATQLGRMSEQKLEILPSGVRTDIFHPIGKSIVYPANFAVLYVGDARRMYLKGFDVFLVALKHLKEKGVPFLACVVGKINAKTEQLTVEHGLDDNVKLIGMVPRAGLAPYYRGADVYVCPSRDEADSTTAIEALACGTPVIGSDIPGINKTLSFQVGDGIDLAGKLVDVYKQKRTYKLEAQRQSNEWSIETVIEKFEEIYHQVTAPNGENWDAHGSYHASTGHSP